MRLSKVDIDSILTKHRSLIARHNNLSRTIRDLHQQTITYQREASNLRNNRFTMLCTHLSAIDTCLAEIYRRVVPGADCYMSYARNPISLFEEGITLMAQHGRSAWREVLYCTILYYTNLY